MLPTPQPSTESSGTGSNSLIEPPRTRRRTKKKRKEMMGFPDVPQFWGTTSKIRALLQTSKRATKSRKTVNTDLLAKQKYALRCEVGRCIRAGYVEVTGALQ
jgi:hypothetical protein